MSVIFKPIERVQVVPLTRIPDERGTVFHMLKCSDLHFTEFGDIYFTTIYHNGVKGWHIHGKVTLNYACIYERIKLVGYDDRPDLPTRGNLQEVFSGPDNYSLVIIPPDVWNGFKGMVDPLSIVANCASNSHVLSFSDRVDPFPNNIPCNWDVRCE
jgi:dTDP-4-dehydrorhamnose 3,5-epimerase